MTKQLVKTNLQLKGFGVVLDEQLLIVFGDKEDVRILERCRNDVAERDILEPFVLADFSIYPKSAMWNDTLKKAQ